MAASSTVGDVNAVYIKSFDQLGNAFQTRVNTNKSTIKETTTYSEVDTAMRQLISMSTNTYEDTLLITAVSVNAEVEGD